MLSDAVLLVQEQGLEQAPRQERKREQQAELREERIGQRVRAGDAKEVIRSIGNSIKKIRIFPIPQFYKYFDLFIIVYEKGLMPY